MGEKQTHNFSVDRHTRYIQLPYDHSNDDPPSSSILGIKYRLSDTIKVLFLYFNLCRSVKLTNLSCSFTSFCQILTAFRLQIKDYCPFLLYIITTRYYFCLAFHLVSHFCRWVLANMTKISFLILYQVLMRREGHHCCDHMVVGCT
jgi:hypothetical protein